jgi:hypothetical protein
MRKNTIYGLMTALEQRARLAVPPQQRRRGRPRWRCGCGRLRRLGCDDDQGSDDSKHPSDSKPPAGDKPQGDSKPKAGKTYDDKYVKGLGAENATAHTQMKPLTDAILGVFDPEGKKAGE